MTKTSLDAFIIYALIGIVIVYWLFGFEPAVLGALGVIAGYLGKIYWQDKRQHKE